jgi:hypothetical protein
MPAYITVSRKDIAESGALRKVLLCRLRRDGFKWYEACRNGPTGTEFTGEEPEGVRFTVRGDRVFLRANGDTREVVRLRIPDSGEYHIFADTPKLARC